MVTLAATDPATLRRHAAQTDECGIDLLGLGDSPLYLDPFVAATVAASATRRIGIGPMVTNLVTRTPYDVARGLLSVEQVGGVGRTFAGLGAGDSALAADGRKPLGVAQFRASIDRFREGGDRLGRVPAVHVAANGPRTLAMAGEYADVVVSGAGLDPASLDVLRTAATRAEPWVVARTSVDPDRDAAITELLPLLASGANHVFAAATNRAALAPDDRARVEQLRARYDYAFHGRAGENPNAALVDTLGLRDLLAERFALVGTPIDIASSLRDLARDGIAGVVVPAVGVDVPRLIDGLGEVLRHLR
jgi:alkanesulfonate monooxygenase SsuD/methylene tetrahydromethanopterin reductase-like flavin-dependent oxidoreductase (luciferase family)